MTVTTPPPTPYIVDAVYCGAPGPGDMARVRVLRLVAWADNPDVRAAVDRAAVEVSECRKWEYMLGVVAWAAMVAAGYGLQGNTGVLRVYGWRRWGGDDGRREWGWFGLDTGAGVFAHLLREGLARDFFGPGVEYAPARELWGEGLDGVGEWGNGGGNRGGTK